MKHISNAVLQSNRELIEKSVIKKKYIPLFDEGNIGCGNYGCVYETKSDDVVLKVTSDLGESRFVIAAINMKEWPEGMVQYYQVMYLGKYSSRLIFGLWRERAFNINELSDTEVNPEFLNSLEFCWNIARQVRLVYEDEYNSNRVFSVGSMDWLRDQQQRYIDYTNVDVGEFNPILHAMGWYAKRSILLGDVHIGNLGQVRRKEHGRNSIWVITDPGEAVFVDEKYNDLFAEYGL